MHFPAPDFFTKVIKEFCFELGLEYSFSVLMKVLSEFIPATHISCSRQDPDKTAILVELNNLDISLPRVSYGEGLRTSLLPYKRTIGGNALYIFDDTRKDGALWANMQKIDDVHRSILSMELFHEGDSIYFMGLRAVEPCAFTVAHAEMLSRLREPIADLVRVLFASEMRAARSLLNAATGPESARAMLRRCRGLSMTLRQIDEVAATSAGVLIMGDTGVGKELVAEAVHENSPRRGHPFVKVNCGAIPESLMEAELFGYERGAFTGAVTAHKGYFEQANGGTLYLDEIGELSPLAQVRLLRVLETREIQRIGSPKRVLLDFRVIAATNKDLAAQVKTGAFREDLWYRINMYVIKVPALDRRRDDIAVLADYFCRRCAVDLGFDYQPEIRPELMRSLYTRDWPGNVRQLRNWVERALLHTRAKNSPVLLSPAEDAEVFHSQAASGRKPGDGEICTLDEAMTRHIHLALRKAGGRVHGRGNAADILGINPGTLRARMRKLGMTQKPA